MFSRTSYIAGYSLTLSGLAAAANVPTHAVGAVAVAPSATSLALTFKNVADPFKFKRIDFTGDGFTIYAANITIGGQSFEVSVLTLRNQVHFVETIAGSARHREFRPMAGYPKYHLVICNY